MAVEVVAGPVVPHCGSRVGVAGGDLDVSQVDARVEHGRDVCGGACEGVLWSSVCRLDPRGASGRRVCSRCGKLSRL